MPLIAPGYIMVPGMAVPSLPDPIPGIAIRDHGKIIGCLQLPRSYHTAKLPWTPSRHSAQR